MHTKMMVRRITSAAITMPAIAPPAATGTIPRGSETGAIHTERIMIFDNKDIFLLVGVIIIEVVVG